MNLFSGDGVVILGAALLFTGVASATKTNDLNLSNMHAVGPTYTASGTMSKQSALLLTNLLRNPHLQVKAEIGKQLAARMNNRTVSSATPTYTASGKMSKQQAVLLTNLLRNPHLQVKAEVGRQLATRINNRTLSRSPAATPTYTASGKMSKQQAILLTNLLRNPHLQVKAEVGKQMNKQKLSKATVATPTYTASGKMSKQQAILLTNLLRNPHLQVKAEVGRQVAQQQIRTNNHFIGAYKPFFYNGKPPVYIQGNTIWYPVPIATITPNIEQAPYPMNNLLDVVSK